MAQPRPYLSVFHNASRGVESALGRKQPRKSIPKRPFPGQRQAKELHPTVRA